CAVFHPKSSIFKAKCECECMNAASAFTDLRREITSARPRKLRPPCGLADRSVRAPIRDPGLSKNGYVG
ncbi:MAG: hypothetical protein ACRD6X_00790, partial [Pyrinomonadaceae bacterium]